MSDRRESIYFAVAMRLCRGSYQKAITIRNKSPCPIVSHYAGPPIIEMCDDVLVRRYLKAPDGEVVRKRRLCRSILGALNDDLDRKSVTGEP